MEILQRFEDRWIFQRRHFHFNFEDPWNFHLNFEDRWNFSAPTIFTARNGGFTLKLADSHLEDR